jgi:LysM repeat protein
MPKRRGLAHEKVTLMRRARVLVFLLLVAIAAAAYFGFRDRAEFPSLPGGQDSPTISADADRSAKGNAERPTFDVVRAEPNGDVVMAGRAEPGWTVTVEGNGKVLGSAVVDPNGEWIIQPPAPVAKGEHSLQLKSQSPKGEQTLFSAQRLALSLGGDQSKSRPLVALTEEGEPTRVLQMSPPLSDEKRLAASPAATANIETPPIKADIPSSEQSSTQVSFTSVDYEQTAGRSTIFLSGRGTPGSRLMLYLDNEFAGTVTVDATGGWTFKAVRNLSAGTHALRADSVELASGKVLSRAEVSFDHQSHQVAELERPAAGSGQTALASRDRSPVGQPQAPAGGDTPKQANGTPGPVKVADTNEAVNDTPEDGGVIVVRRGDTLWHIARQQYGNGKKFTEIFQNNRGQIRNPNLIYPSQRFSIPR